MNDILILFGLILLQVIITIMMIKLSSSGEGENFSKKGSSPSKKRHMVSPAHPPEKPERKSKR